MVTPPYEWPTAFCMKKYIQYTPFVVLQIFSVFAKIFLDIPIVRSERSNKTLMTRDITIPITKLKLLCQSKVNL